MLKKLLVLGLLLGCGQVAEGATPTVINHIETTLPTYVSWIDGETILGTTQTVTVPEGRAILIWTITGTPGEILSESVYVGPKIGDQVGERLQFSWFSGGVHHTAAGSWAFDCPGGELDVSFHSDNFATNHDDSLSWTLIVFPDAADPVPAVGGLGLLVIAASMIAAGAWIMQKRRALAA